jgi:UDPglucose 6-dehydrogenase
MNDTKIGFIGLGKLGLPCASAMSVLSGKTISGYDINKNIQQYIKSYSVPYVENKIEDYLSKASIDFKDSIESVVMSSDIVFIAVQTPHDPMFEGTTPLPEERKDFDYSYLIATIKEINEVLLLNKNKNIDIVIISTVLPGTIKEKIRPILTAKRDGVNLLYNPYFIAMGTTIDDFINPEFILIGGKYNEAQNLSNFYRSILSARIVNVRTASAEIIKVSYNTFIGMKIVFANAIAEIIEKSQIGCSEEVFGALSIANNRIISSKYMSPGMGDGGGCHPRDQIAMSYLAKKLDLSVDLFEFLANARDKQTEYHAQLIADYQNRLTNNCDVVILGRSYKKNIGLEVGSPSKLLQYYLDKLGVRYEVIDPYFDNEPVSFDAPKIFYVATPHDHFKNLSMPVESIVLDPWGNSVTKQYNIPIISIGRWKEDN